MNGSWRDMLGSIRRLKNTPTLFYISVGHIRPTISPASLLYPHPVHFQDVGFNGERAFYCRQIAAATKVVSMVTTLEGEGDALDHNQSFQQICVE